MFKKSLEVVLFHPFVVSSFINRLAPIPSNSYRFKNKTIQDYLCTDPLPQLVSSAVDDK